MMNEPVPAHLVQNFFLETNVAPILEPDFSGRTQAKIFQNQNKI